MSMSFYRDKIQKLQQMLDNKDEEIKRLTNELFLCQETKQTKSVAITKGNSTQTPLVEFENSNVATILKGRLKAMKMYTEKRDE